MGQAITVQEIGVKGVQHELKVLYWNIARAVTPAVIASLSENIDILEREVMDNTVTII